MKQHIKEKFKKFIFKCIDEYRRREINKKNNPYFLNLHESSKIMDPFQIDGGKNIFIGEGTFIGNSIWLSAFESYSNQKFNPEIRIGNYVNIGNHACITAINKIVIGNNCLFSDYIYISDHSHGFNPVINVRPALQNLDSKGAVEIGENTFLGFRVCILPGVKLGKNCVVGSNSVVTKSFPDFSMVGGVPARLLKKYSVNQNKWIPENIV